MPAEAPTDGRLIKIDHLTLEQVEDLDDVVFTRTLRRILGDPEKPSDDYVAAFSNRL